MFDKDYLQFIIDRSCYKGGGCESMDGRGFAILALEVIPKNLIFA